MVERQPSKLNVASSSLVSRSKNCLFRPSSSVVERILGKDEVTSSILVSGLVTKVILDIIKILKEVTK